MTAGRVLVLGGARSGKSAFAEALVTPAFDHGAVDYVATAAPLNPTSADPEWAARIANHQARRPAAWRTLETRDLSGVFALDSDRAVLVDSMTAWLTAVLDEHGAWEGRPAWRPAVAAEVEQTLAAWAVTDRAVVAVSDEVGGGIVPESASGRLFRDELGLLNQRLAAAADTVWLVTAGLGQRLK